MTEHVSSALLYAGLGWRVVPIHTTRRQSCSCGRQVCPGPGKHPRVRDWSRAATTNADEIRTWWRRWPEANVGVVTGRESGLFALDVDVDRGGEDLLAALENAHGQLPQTVDSLTGGGGRHLLFAYPEKGNVPSKSDALGPGIDVRGEGGLIIVPPSLHASGRRYEWEDSSRPFEVELAEPPLWVLELVQRRATPSRTLPNEIGEGRRNATLARIAGAQRRVGLEAPEMNACLIAVNRHRCRPPLDPSEVERIAESIARYPAGPPWITDPATFYTGTGGTDQLVLRTLVDFADRNGECFPSVRTLAQWTGLALNTITAAVTRLEAARRVEVARTTKGPRRAVNHYRIIWPLNGASAAATELPAATESPSSLEGDW